jgi:hypothetical protein
MNRLQIFYQEPQSALKPVQAVIIIAEAESNGKVPFSKWALFGSHHILLFVQGFCNESNLKFYAEEKLKS